MEQPQIEQRCHFPGVGFGTILEIREGKKEGVRINDTMELRIRFDAGTIRWKSLNDVELIKKDPYGIIKRG